MDENEYSKIEKYRMSIKRPYLSNSIRMNVKILYIFLPYIIYRSSHTIRSYVDFNFLVETYLIKNI